MVLKTNSADPFTTDDKNQLWKSGTIDFYSSKALSYGMVFYNGEMFGFWAMNKYVNLVAITVQVWKRFEGSVHGIYWTSEQEYAGWIATTKG